MRRGGAGSTARVEAVRDTARAVAFSDGEADVFAKPLGVELVGREPSQSTGAQRATTAKRRTTRSLRERARGVGGAAANS
jgi:hypothetical protein